MTAPVCALLKGTPVRIIKVKAEDGGKGKKGATGKKGGGKGKKGMRKRKR